MSLDLSPSPRTIVRKPQRRPPSTPKSSKRPSSRSTFPRRPSISLNPNPLSYLLNLEYPEERKRSFAQSDQDKITSTERVSRVMTGSPPSDDDDRPGKKLKLNNNNEDADPDHNNNLSQTGLTSGDSSSSTQHVFSTSGVRTNWWDDDECEEDSTTDSLSDSTSSIDSKDVEDQVESTPCNVLRGRSASTCLPIVTSIPRRRSRSADSPPLSPEALQYELLNESSVLAENPFASPGDDFVDDGEFKAYFDMNEASSNSLTDGSAWSPRRGRKRSKSLTPPSSPPKAKPYDLIYSSLNATETITVQNEFSGYPAIGAGEEEEEAQSMDVEYPSIYSPSTASETSNYFEFGVTETRESLGLGLITNDHPNGNSPDAPNVQYPSLHQRVAGQDGVDTTNATDVTNVVHIDSVEEILVEIDEQDDLLRAQWEMVRRGLYVHDHIDRFHLRMNQRGGNYPDHTVPRPYSPLGFYPPLTASGLPAYLRLKELEEEGKKEVESPKSATDSRSASTVSPSWSDLDESEDDEDYFKELPLFS